MAAINCIMAIPAVRRFPTLPLALLAVFFALSALLQLDRAWKPMAGLAASVEGEAASFGDVPGGALGAHGYRYWSTWGGSDSATGRVVLDTFPAPYRFALMVRGYPGIGQNSLTVVNTISGEEMALKSDSNPDEAWATLHIDVPRAWRHAPLQIVATDSETGWGGWFAFTEPLVAPWWANWWSGILPRLAVFALAGIALLTLAAAARRWLCLLGFGRDPLACLFAIGLVALIGWLEFWLYFARASVGITTTWIVFGVALGSLFIPSKKVRDTAAADPRDVWVPVALIAGAGLLAFAALHLYSVDDRVSRLAAGRFGPLPSDNEIPQVFASRLLHDQSPRGLFGEWLSSDRPPLQTGWQLLVTRPLLGIGIDFDTAVQFAGIWFQLAWIPAAWAWLRHMTVQPPLAALLLAAMMPCTFLVLNTVFIWPKLVAGGFLVGAFLCWYPFSPDRVHGSRFFAAGGVLAALAWLAHGGVAFALLPLAPLLFFRLGIREPRKWMVAALAFAILTLPWSAYQRFYEPPGNRLLKWHLAGQVEPDDRSTMGTLLDAYGSTPVSDLGRARLENLATIFKGEWRNLLTFSADPAGTRRDREGAYTFFALGWWNLGFLALPALFLTRALRRRLAPTEWSGIAAALVWALATLAVWVALMFLPNSTVIHQGSYTTLVLLLPMLALALWRVHPAVFAAVALAQIIGFARVTLAPPPASDPMPWRVDSTTLLLLAAGLLVASFALARRSPRRDAAVSNPGHL